MAVTGSSMEHNAAHSYSELKSEVGDFHFDAMAEDVKVTQEKPCCAAWHKKYSNLMEKHSKLNYYRNQWREATSLVNQKFQQLEKENGHLKQAMGDLEVQVSRWKDEKEKEFGIRVDLEDEVSALKEEIQLLKQNDASASEGADEKFQERLDLLVKEINQMKDLLEKEKVRVDLEKKNAKMQMKKADDALKKVEQEKNKVSEAQGLAKIESKRAEENRLLLEKLKKENDALKSKMDIEKSKYEAADKKLEAEMQKTINERKRVDLAVAKAEEQRELAEMNMKKAEEYKLLWEKMKMELDVAKSMLLSERSKSEAAEKKVEAEKQNTSREKKRAELEVAKGVEQRKLAETHLEKHRFEKNRADSLTQKLEEEMTRVKRLEEELHGHICSMKLVEAHAGEPNTGKIVELTSGICKGTETGDVPTSQKIKVLLEKDQSIIKEKKHADSEIKKAKKHQKVAEEHKKMAIQEKQRADRLSKELEDYKLRLKELGKEPQVLHSYRINGDNSQRCNDILYETETVKLLKKQLKLEKMLSKHAKKATKLEVFRNNMLHQELLHLKQECLRFQQHLDMLDDSFLNDREGIYELEKVGNETFKRQKFFPDQFHGQLTSGIDSRLNHPCRGSKRNILQSSAIHSSSASISDQPLVGSPDRGTFSVITTARRGEEVSNLELSCKKRMRYSENNVAKAENIRSPIRGRNDESTVGCSNMRNILDSCASVENLYSKSHKLHQQVPQKLTKLHGLLNDKKDEPTAEILIEKSCGKQLRPFKRKNTSHDRAIVIHPLHESGNPVLHSDIDDSKASMHVTSPVTDIMKLDQCLESRTDAIIVTNQCIPTESDDNAIYDYMKLLDLNDAADEKSYCRAIASPLSPTLPDIDFYGDEVLEVDYPELLVDKSSQEGLPIEKYNLASASSADAYNMEKEPTNFLLNDLASLKLLREDGHVKRLRKTDLLHTSHAHVHQIGVTGENVGNLDLYGSRNEEVKILCERRTTPFHGDLLKCCVISSDNKDSHSILRIIKTTSSCMPQCSLLDSADIFLRSLLTTLNAAEDITMKERVCVLFCIMLLTLTEVEMVNSTNSLSDDFVQSLASTVLPISSALSDLAFRRRFMESCDLCELLALIEDFLQQRKVLVCADASAKTQVLRSPTLILDLNGNAISLYEQVASAHQLVVASSLLASICSGIDHIGLLCELSCNIFSMEKLDPALALAVVHAFAHTCGSKYFTLHQNNLAVTFIKSLVSFLEKHMLSTNSQLQTEIPDKIWSCSPRCPFSEGALSVEDVGSLLVKNIQVYRQSISWKQYSCETLNSLNFRVCLAEEHIGGDLGPTDVVPLSTTCDENLFRFIEILSLVEILATFMGWDWTNDNFVSQFCEFLESRLMEDSDASIIILLGQLGRLGVVASGYEGTGVKELRERLSAFLCWSSFTKLSLVAQSAFMNALLGLTPLKFEEIVQSKVEIPLALSDSIDADFVKKWFYMLSNEQQSSFRLQQADGEMNCSNRFLSRKVCGG